VFSLFKVDSLQKNKACPGARRATRCRRPGIFPTDRKTQRIKSFQLGFSIRWRFSFWLWLVHVGKVAFGNERIPYENLLGFGRHALTPWHIGAKRLSSFSGMIVSPSARRSKSHR
jgi:hypothetical protein